jgi:hypothetical protein
MQQAVTDTRITAEATYTLFEAESIKASKGIYFKHNRGINL